MTDHTDDALAGSPVGHNASVNRRPVFLVPDSHEFCFDDGNRMSTASPSATEVVR
jgi:hypothetical protein